MSLQALFKTNLKSVKRQLFNAYKQDEGHRRAIYNSLIQVATSTYRNTVQREIKRVKCEKSATVSPLFFSEIELIIREHSFSIVKTYNRELESEIERVIDGNQNLKRADYADLVELWIQARQERKLAQIVTMTQKIARDYALNIFVKQNKITGNRYLFTGAPPAEEVCASYFAAGVVDQNFVDLHPTPVHVNCPHEWRVISSTAVVDCETLFTG